MENMCKRDLMSLIQRTGFVLLDLALYLDTHPDCACALETYHEHRKIFNDALAVFQRRFEPLSIMGVYDENFWTWGNEPWPWQKECD